jgi:hypothetical protein
LYLISIYLNITNFLKKQVSILTPKKMKKKTVYDFLMQMPQDISSKALINANKEVLAEEADSVCDALAQAFVWEKSPQGHDYWESIFNAYEDDISADNMFGSSLN